MKPITRPVTTLPGVGPAFNQLLNKLDIKTVEDLLLHIPFRYVDFSKKIEIKDAQVGAQATLEGKVTNISSRRSFKSRMQFSEALLSDKSGNIKLVWFNQPWVAQSLKSGETIVVSGKIEKYKQLQIVNPLYEIKGKDGVHTGRLLPIYHLTAKLSNLRLVKLIDQAFKSTKVDDFLPDILLKKHGLPSFKETLETLHYPESYKYLSTAQLRLAVNDTLPQQIAVIKKRELDAKIKAPKNKIHLKEIQRFIKSISFALTDSQKRAAWDILQEIETSKPMNRLLQGDVSSGKTIIAIIAALSVSHSNNQTIILAPTEVLAKQHFVNFSKFLENTNTNIALLTRSLHQTNYDDDADKDSLVKDIASNKSKIIIGTHALLTEKISIPNLSLVVIDEQHRFGVAQRAHLTKQGNKFKPHMLTMSATPIPRTLALSFYGDLTVSQLKHVPSDRKPIITQLVKEDDRKKAYNHIKTQIQQGRQAFVIVPKVESTESEIKSVKEEYENLLKIFPGLKLGLVYGKQKAIDKDKTMREFADGNIDILVATTVIEIGIDVPNATIMLIEGAENFGLAQLHQLRGRVGRSEHQSHCYVFTTQDNPDDIERLKIFASNTDGFALAEYDLEHRGFGDLFGKEQSGFNFRFPEFITTQALGKSKQVAEDVVKQGMLGSMPEIESAAQIYLKDIHME